MNIYSPYIYGAFIQSGSTSYIREDLGVGFINGIHSSAKFEVSGTTKGVLFPRMTESQKNAIATPATSLLVYQTDGTAGYYYYNGSAWAIVGSGNGDTFVTGGTYSNGTATFRNNTGGTFNVTGFSTATGNLIGSGTANYIPKFTGSTGVSNSIMYDNGTSIGIGTTSPIATSHIINNTAPSFNAVTGFNTMRLSYSGGSNFGDYGSGLLFSQKWFASNPLLVDVGGIYGVKTEGDGNFGGGLAIFTTPLGSSTLSEAARFISNGFFGIKTQSPNALLDVNGDALINTVSVGLGGSNISTNTILGNKALTSNINGSENLAVGFNSLSKNTNGSGNVAIGVNSMFNNDDGNSNIAIGPFSLFNGISNRGSIAIGSSSLLNAEGRNNLAIGSNSAVSLTNGDNNNVIGNENDFTPNGNSLSSDRNLLSISKNNDSNVGYPQIWSPEQVLVNFMTTGKVLPISSYIYAAVFIDYVILDTNLSSRAGTLKCVFDANRTNIKWNETTTGDIGSTSDYVFDFIDNGSDVMLELTNNNTSYDVYINYTARLILRPII